ncbi:MAG: sulfite exporter TauE/SafE family protein, partial [Aquirufa sp.]
MEFWILLGLLGVMAFLYASVGHGGASGYLAVLAIFAVAPAVMKQTALILNLGVSLLAFYHFYKKGY